MILCTGTNCLKEAVGYRLNRLRHKIPLCQDHFTFCWKHLKSPQRKMKMYCDEPRIYDTEDRCLLRPANLM
jgi:hypothetical protein